MGNRLAGIIATLWFFFALMSLFIALILSPMGLRLLLPDKHPGTWIYPALLTLPPIVLGISAFFKAKVSRLLLWSFAVVLGAVTLLLFAFLTALFVGH